MRESSTGIWQGTADFRVAARRSYLDDPRQLTVSKLPESAGVSMATMLPKADHSWTVFEAAHLLNRAGFGGDPAELRRLHALGREAAVAAMLAPTEVLDDFPALPWTRDEQVQADRRANTLENRAVRRAQQELPQAEAEEMKRKSRQRIRLENRARGLEAQAWWFQRMLTTQAPLREKMTLFWHDHFATSIQKVKHPVLLFRQNELFRSYAFGSFSELTHAMLVDPAMALYLDTQSSTRDMPNENFARELLELFTLGEGHYSEHDITQAARAFTGYRVSFQEGKVEQRHHKWDPGAKTIFGITGNFTGKEVVDLIFTQKQAARLIPKKLWEFFVYENPSAAILDALAATFQQSNFQIAPVLREIFLSQEFYAETSRRTQIKSPVQFLLGLLKQLEITTPPADLAVSAGQQLGQVLFAPPNVAGWDWGKAWINTNTLLTRYNIAGLLSKGSGVNLPALLDRKAKNPSKTAVSKRKQPPWQGPDYDRIAPRPLRENTTDLVDSLIFRFFQGPLPAKVRDSFIEYANAKKGAIFTHAETAELCHLMLSTPYYQLT